MSSQALVAFRGNHYSVPPGLAGTTLTVSHRLGELTLDVATASGTVLARHRREPDGAGVVVRDTVHVTALETAVLVAFSTGKPCHRKARRPPTPAALAQAEHLRSNGTSDGSHPHYDLQSDEVVVDLARWAAAAEDRRVAP